MDFGPLNYQNPKGIYEEDPDTEAMRAKMERNLLAKLGRQARKLMSQHAWVIKHHGSLPHSMSLAVEFSLVTQADINAIIKKAKEEERKRFAGRVMDFVEQQLS